ncbi:MAG: type II toxin-antitoxin system VapC family toxin [Bryobacteraceae bacterium]
MTYLLDTNAISDLMRSAPGIENWMAALDPRDRVIVCTIVRGELLFGVARLPEGRRRTELEDTAHRFLAAFPCEPITARVGDFYAAVKISRQRMGLVLDENDLWIAATALAGGATLVSRDRDFAGIEGLALTTVE